MTERKYRNLRIQELEALVAESWDHEDMLREVAAELTFRHTRRASRLQSSIETRVRQTPVFSNPTGLSSPLPEISQQEHSFVGRKACWRRLPMARRMYLLLSGHR